MGAVKSWEEDDVNPGEARPSSGAATLFATSLLVLSLLTLSACMTVPKGRGDYDAGYVERGVASWYGGYFHGRPTASGTIYDQFRMTAAHRLLPLGSMVRVTNAQNGREVMAVINDRGPFIRGRVIDLSYAVAQQLGVVKQGTIPVLIEVVLMGNRGAMPPFVRMTEMEQGDGVTVGWYVLWVAQSEDPRDGDAWISEVGNLVRPAARGSRDVLRAPPRSRKSRV
jgi:rare lipoprotein A